MNFSEKLYQDMDLPNKELKALIETDQYDFELFHAADKVRKKYYGTDVYIRGLIEFSNYCKNDCYYCGIRKNNLKINRYRLGKEEILNCCSEGYSLGFRTFVLQGGEDLFYTDELICEIITEIKKRHPDCAVTLSMGEKSYNSYKLYYAAGADRYLLRHETANAEHYLSLHPNSMSFENRKKCLWDLKDIGFQVGSGFMVGSPYQKTECLIEDLRFLQQLKPDMIGIGPYIVHNDTPFKDFNSGNLQLCLRMIAILRLVFPYALIPATTALGTINPKGRELGLLAGANVVMPNLSPVRVREFYKIYENKISTGEEAAEYKTRLEKQVAAIGYQIVIARGDAKAIS